MNTEIIGDTMTDQLIDERKHGFFMIDNAVLLNYPLTPHEFTVYSVIVLHSNPKTRSAWPGLTRIAEVARMSRRQVIRCLQSLEKYGLIVIQPQKSPDGQANQVNHYVIPVVEHQVVTQSHIPSDSESLGVVTGSHPNNTHMNNKRADSFADAKSRLKPANLPSRKNTPPRRWTSEQINDFYREPQHQPALDELQTSWYGDTFVPFPNMTLTERRRFIGVYRELAEIGVGPDEYTSLVKYVRSLISWKRTSTIEDVVEHVTEWRRKKTPPLRIVAPPRPGPEPEPAAPLTDEERNRMRAQLAEYRNRQQGGTYE